MQFILEHTLQQNPSPIRPLQRHTEFQLRHGRIIIGAEKTEVAPFPIQHQQMFITNQTVAWRYLLQRGKQRRCGSRQNLHVPYLRQEILVLRPERGWFRSLITIPQKIGLECVRFGFGAGAARHSEYTTGWIVRGSNPSRGKEFFCSPQRSDRLWGPHYSMGTGVLSRG